MTSFIPKYLQDAKFRFVRLAMDSKAPIDKDWTKTGNYEYNNELIKKHLKDGKNVGVALGYGNLVILDIDNKDALSEAESRLPETFTVETGRGGRHYYFFAATGTEKVILEKNKIHYGELQAKGTQCLLPGSIHPINKKEYQVIKDLPIANLTTMKINELKFLFCDPEKNYEVKAPWENYKASNVSLQLPITQIVNILGAKQSGQEYYMAHPIHGSATGMNFFVNPNKNLWHCFRCNAGGDSLAFLAIKEGICNCSDFSKNGKKLRGEDFLKIKNICESRYNMKFEKSDEPEKIFNTMSLEEQNALVAKLTAPTLLWDKDLQLYQESTAPWLVDKLIRPKTVGIIAGKRKTLKSFVTLTLMYSLANGLSIFNKFPCIKTKALYLDRENGYQELKIRSGLIRKGLNLTTDSDIAYLSENQIKIDNTTHIAILEKIITENKIGILFVDTYRRVISFDENDAGEVSKLFVDLLKPLAERTGIAIVLLHHERKGESNGDEMDMIRGSSDLVNYADWIIQVERKGNVVTIKQTKQRSAMELEPFLLKVDTDEKTYFKFTYDGDKVDSTSRIETSIVNWCTIEGKTTFTYAECIKAMTMLNYKESRIKNTLQEMQQEGKLNKGPGKRDPYAIVYKKENQEELE